MTFKDYADAATSAGTRTRNSLYLLIVVLVASLGIQVNTTVFRFAAERMRHVEIARDCLNTARARLVPGVGSHSPVKPDPREPTGPELVGSPEHPWPETYLERLFPEPEDVGCRESVAWASRMDLPIALTQPIDGKFVHWQGIDGSYTTMLSTLQSNRAALRTIQIPIFGVVIDLEDLGLLSGLMFTALLGVCVVNMRSELAWLVGAARIASENPDPKESVDQTDFLRRIQIVGSPLANNRVARNVPFAIFMLVAAVHLWTYNGDVNAYNNTKVLLGDASAGLFFDIERGFTGAVFAIMALAIAYWALLIRVLSEGKKMYGCCYWSWLKYPIQAIRKQTEDPKLLWHFFLDPRIGKDYFEHIRPQRAGASHVLAEVDAPTPAREPQSRFAVGFTLVSLITAALAMRRRPPAGSPPGDQHPKP